MGDKKKKSPAEDKGGHISASAFQKGLRTTMQDVMAPIVEGMNSFGKHIKGLTRTVQTMAASATSKEANGDLEEILASAGLSLKDVKAAKKMKPQDESTSSDGDGSESASSESVEAKKDKEISAEGTSVEASASTSEEIVASASKSASVSVEASASASASAEHHVSTRRFDLGNLKASGRLPKNVVKAMHAAADEINTLRAADAKKTKAIKRLSGKLEVIQAQNTKFADQLDRKTLPGDASALLSKAGYDVSEMMSAGQTLSTEQVDEIIQASGLRMSSVDSMRFKNVLYEKGLMGRGDIQRFTH